jgi:esterase/lipase superfamily enzyme
MSTKKNVSWICRIIYMRFRYFFFLSAILTSCAKLPFGSRDSDKDGIADRRDKCPNSPAGVTVDRNGCPLDSDGDGVPERVDIAIDIDNDGVPDSQDKCPNDKGHLLNYGCPIKFVIPYGLSQALAKEYVEKLEENLRRVTIFFCTNRSVTKQNGDYEFGGGISTLTYGTRQITIPRYHEMGQVEIPASIFGYEIESPDPNKHIIVEDTKLVSRDELLRLINRKTDESDRKDAFVFVHGFNNTFEEASMRTAQFAYDLGFRGAPILFSWPSQGGIPGVLLYKADEKANEASIEPFKSFMREFLQKSTAQNVYLIAHSMGNRIMVTSLKQMMADEPELFRNRRIREIVLTAPDISVKDFKRDIVPVINGNVAPITLYVSSKDKAIVASAGVNRNVRAGQAGKKIVVMRGIETIDASDVATDFLGHSYFSSTGSVVSDLHYLFRDNLRAKQRQKWLVQPSGIRYWKFKTTQP